MFGEDYDGEKLIWTESYNFNSLGNSFEIKDNGVLMKDIITYIPPLGLIGQIANKIFIKKQLKNIFDYRQKVINKKFNQ